MTKTNFRYHCPNSPHGEDPCTLCGRRGRAFSHHAKSLAWAVAQFPLDQIYDSGRVGSHNRATVGGICHVCDCPFSGAWISHLKEGKSWSCCCPTGTFRPNDPATFYLWRTNDGRLVFGITNVPQARFQVYRQRGHTLVAQWLFQRGHEALAVERLLKGRTSAYAHLRASGGLRGEITESLVDTPEALAAVSACVAAHWV